jgi:hypothetical protein
MKTQELLITPTKAKELLEANVSNRPLRPAAISKYARDMRAGLWREQTGEAIKIAESGIMLDGQNRLHALIEANVSLKFLVITEMPNDVFAVLDSGVKRSSSDAFYVAGISHYTTVPAIISAWNFYKTGKYSARNGDSILTQSQVMNIYNERKMFWDAIAPMAHKWYHDFAKILSVSKIGGFYAATHEINEQKALSFMNELCIGMNFTNNSVFILRKRLIENNASVTKLKTTQIEALMIKTWNAYLTGKVLKIMKFNPMVEEFPKL